MAVACPCLLHRCWRGCQWLAVELIAIVYAVGLDRAAGMPMRRVYVDGLAAVADRLRQPDFARTRIVYRSGIPLVQDRRRTHCMASLPRSSFAGSRYDLPDTSMTT